MSAVCPIVVLIGGNGSNLQALIHAAGKDFKIAGVISHRPQAYGLVRAANAEIPTITINHQDFSEREDFDTRLAIAVESFSPQLIVLAGFMRILSSCFIRRFAGKIINIHPSLLPKYKGLNTHQRALDAGDRVHGATVHFVDETLDGGPVIAQVQVPIQSDDNVETLANRVHRSEHGLYPQVVSWLAQKRLNYDVNGVTFDGQPLPPFGLQLVSEKPNVKA